MKALICDRCKKAYVGDSKRGTRKYTLRTIGTEVVRKQMSRGTPLDLCDDCYESLMKWLEMDRQKGQKYHEQSKIQETNES